ncbi:T2E6.16 [Arabidopsis thaliana]|nr:T2E6.16 [Arabidopsis thaliana]
MEQQKQKKRKVVSKSKRTQSKSASSLPLDLTSEILLRLPEKSIARFRCVSKLWLSITTDPYFINLFETRSPRPSLLVCFIENDKLFVSSIPQHLHSLQNSKSKRQLITLPIPRLSWNNIIVFLGYDPVEGKHKVMCLPFRRSSDVCQVLTLGPAQEFSWITVKTYHKHCSDYQSSGRCIKGVVYYIAQVYHTHAWVLMCFDVRSEKFDMIKLHADIYREILITYEGRIACVEKRTTKDDYIALCILEDAKKDKWSSKDILAPFGHFDERLRTFFQLKGCTHDGEFIFVSSTFRKMDYILFFDPVKKTFRRFELKEIADDQARVNNGDPYGPIFAFCAFLDHVESQMSLQ